MNIATEVATRSTCDRKHVGAVIVRDKSILATGYNGSIRGLGHCDDEGHLMEDGHCVRTVHAEANAIVQAARNGMRIEGAVDLRDRVAVLGLLPAHRERRDRADRLRRVLPRPEDLRVSQKLGIELVDFSKAAAPERSDDRVTRRARRLGRRRPGRAVVGGRGQPCVGRQRRACARRAPAIAWSASSSTPSSPTRFARAATTSCSRSSHGAVGEDGSLQGLLEVLDMPVRRLRRARERARDEQAHREDPLRGRGLPVAPALDGRGAEATRGALAERALRDVGERLVVKPCSNGSAIGVARFDTGVAAAELARGHRGRVAGRRRRARRALRARARGHVRRARDRRRRHGATADRDPRRKRCILHVRGALRPGSERAPLPGASRRRRSSRGSRRSPSPPIARSAAATSAVPTSSSRARRRRVTLLEVNTMPGFTDTSLYPEAAGVAWHRDDGALRRLRRDGGRRNEAPSAPERRPCRCLGLEVAAHLVGQAVTTNL